ncbi:hypothetical protein PVAR5_5638 [Paecilomyces variotii No. 5]|uniref:Uncharacterized protein n=1 Tax=Byssochlamys spectabilis (strain No. 5 / NBRC 109023) TaxID=1356009 RepID=V5I292_BYSSN|nr:hypothetical protein PVAR5_5638 [Paecilomyces variotii No. 5]
MKISTTVVATLMALLGSATAELHVEIFSDGNCQNSLGQVITLGLCNQTHPGFSSMKIVRDKGSPTVGTVTAYTQNNCGCPTCGSHGYDVNDNGCLRDFGFVGNAIGFI